ncbi:hypothetical protein DOTSEDRAFT_85379 [Dothistroma septosporum NZE10]|uniref:Uncharacterized protein n=1 Tax=Dothistroma septosporum (strain NZE10 / CBS 128990) TaxID=675120 RepID=N1Q553_DOTSN|nr:hypothetical protein DOTSEDRAFT_85379 [Dothistroma septosporum NZE10]
MLPPKLPWTTSTAIGLKAFWKWFLTPFGFLIILYGLDVVVWGGMLFLLLCNASPAMCWAPDGRGGKFHDCNDINSPRREWRKHGKKRKMYGLRKLAAHYRSWYRLPGSETLDAVLQPDDIIECDLRVPMPVSKRTNDPPTGERAPPTPIWKLDFFIWCQVWNIFFQCCLCGFMWGLNRYNRPSWATGLFVALACGVAGIGGLVSFLEGTKVKRIEGVSSSLAQTEAVQESIHLRQENSGNEVQR